MGAFGKKSKNYQKSIELYSKSIKILQDLETPISLYEAQKSQLITYQLLGNNEEVGKQVPTVLNLAEKYREKISKEQERNSFFDNEQTIYDIAIEYEIQQSNYEKAFNYVEVSTARSLLDWQNKGAVMSANDTRFEAFLDESTEPLTVKEIQKKMPSEVQILQYTVLKDKTLIWLISKERFDLVLSTVNSDKLEEKVKEYIKLLKLNDSEKQKELQTLGKDLYEYLINPILSKLDSTKEISIIPNKFLFQMPFASLVLPDENYFLNKFTFFYSPSSNIFIASTDIAQKKSNLVDENILSIGNPTFDRTKFNLDDLPKAEAEVNEISKFYKTYKTPQKLIGREATKEAFQSLYEDANIIHFAGHYVVNNNSPLLSSLILATAGEDINESVLTNAELLGKDLSKTKLVILSACDTGVEGYYSSEGLIGLSRTFLASGVPLVVASQWKVDSDATAELMKSFHRYRKQEKLSTAKALRLAQLEMLKDKEFQNPYYWAAFTTFGGFSHF